MEDNKPKFQDHLRRYTHRLSSAIGLSRKAGVGDAKDLKAAANAADTLEDMIMFLDLLDTGTQEERLFYVHQTVIPTTTKAVLAARGAMREIGASARDSFRLTKNEAAQAICNVADILEQIEEPVQHKIQAELDLIYANEPSPAQTIRASMCDAVNFLATKEESVGKNLSTEQKQNLREICKPLNAILGTFSEAGAWIQMSEKKGDAPVYMMGAIDTYNGAKNLLDVFLTKNDALCRQTAERLNGSSEAYRQSPQGAYDVAVLSLLTDTSTFFQDIDRHMARASATLRKESPVRAPKMIFAP